MTLKRALKTVVHRLLYGSIYNPKRYWFLRGLTYKRDFYKRYLQGNLKRDNLAVLLNTLEGIPFQSLLEVGCGYGICLKALQEHFSEALIHGCEVSQTQLFNARKFLGKDSKIVLHETDGVTLPYADKSFDIVFTYGVCIHVAPVNISAFIQEILRVGRNVYIFLESSSGTSSFYYFSHDYEAIFRDLGIPLNLVREFVPSVRERLYVADISGRYQPVVSPQLDSLRS
jgi:ubiquinone/menaquinone biosynthesis C-methylase UbiE